MVASQTEPGHVKTEYSGSFYGLRQSGGSCKNDPAGFSKNRMEKHLCLSRFETLPH